jgi:ribulose-5-phosphate 4-epimerase/fuculose-1-phosphate aldolase
MSQEEGVVKYSLEFTKTQSCAFEDIKEIEQTRKDLYTLGLVGAYPDGIGFGNISQKESGSSDFFITGTQTGHLENLQAQDYALVEKVDFKTFTTYASGASKPSSEAVTHACIYDLDENINAVIHVHNEKLWRYMLEGDYISTSDVEYGSLEMVKDIQDIYKNLNPLDSGAFVMKGHFEGVFVFGKNIQEAKVVLYQILAKII